MFKNALLSILVVIAAVTFMPIRVFCSVDLLQEDIPGADKTKITFPVRKAGAYSFQDNDDLRAEIIFRKKGIKRIDVVITDSGSSGRKDIPTQAYIEFDSNGRAVKCSGLFLKYVEDMPTHDGGLVETGSYRYNKSGLLTEGDEGDIYRYKYNERGDLIEFSQITQADFLRKIETYGYEYDAKGNKVSAVADSLEGFGDDIGDLEKKTKKKVSFEYAGNNQIIKETTEDLNGGNGILTRERLFNYDFNGRLISLQIRGNKTSRPDKTLSYKYDDEGKLIEQEESVSGGKDTIVLFEYKYDRSGNLSNEDLFVSRGTAAINLENKPAKSFNFSYQYAEP